MKTFLLEDDPTRILLFQDVIPFGSLYVAKSFDEGKFIYEHNRPFQLCLLDHDLADAHYEKQDSVEGTGYEFCRWLNKEDYPDEPFFIVHSWNIQGAMRMVDCLGEYYLYVTRKPFGNTLLGVLKLAVNEGRLPTEEELNK